MISEILPVPVLAEPSTEGIRDQAALGSGLFGEARESTHSKRTVIAQSDSRGGQKLSDEDELDAWLGTLPRKTRFMLAMAISALSLEKGQCRSRDDLVCFLTAAGLPITRQAIESIECRALRKCRRSELAKLAREHLITK